MALLTSNAGCMSRHHGGTCTSRQIAMPPPAPAPSTRGDPWAFVGEIVVVLKDIALGERVPVTPRQEFLNRPIILLVMLLLLATSLAIGLGLYQSGAALPLVAGWFLLPPLVAIVLMFSGLRRPWERRVHWRLVELRVRFQSRTPVPSLRPPIPAAQ